MNKFLKYGLLGAGGLGLLVVGGAAYIAATFNPNDYKTQIIQAVKDKQQRTLKLDGDIQLTFFPSIGANLGKVSLSEFKSENEFAAIDSVHISLALLPLFSRQVVVDEMAVSGLKATLVKLKNGKTNIDDLLSKDDSKSAGVQMKFDIASVRVEKTGLTYRDETSGAQYVLKDINLKTGRIANGVPCKLDFAAVIQSGQSRYVKLIAVHPLDMALQLKTTLTFDLEKQAYRLEGLDLQANGVAPGIDNLAASLALPMLEGNAQTFKAGMLTLALDIKQPEQAFPLSEFSVKLSSPVNGNLEIPQFNLSDLTVAVNAVGAKLPNKSASGEMRGSVQVDGERQSVQVNLAGGLLQSQVKAKVALNGFSNPAIRFDVEVDQLDADLYLPKKYKSGSAKVDAASAQPPLDLSALRKLNLEGSLRIGTFKVANIKSSQLRLDIKARNGVLDINPLSANLYQGSMNGSVTVNAVPAKPSFAINENLSGINIAPLLKNAANFATLEGKGNVSLNLNTQADTVTALKQALNGNMALNLADGAVKGINIAKKLRDAQGMLGKGGAAQTQAANKDEKTDFSELKASFKVNNGVAHNDDLSLKSPLLRMSGNGDINIGNDSINYLAKATLATTLEGQGGRDSVGGITVPVRLSGPFTDLKYTLDFGAMVSGAAKQKIQTEVKTKLQGQLKGGLKGLLK